MTWVKPVRIGGALTGIALVAMGSMWLLTALRDPPTQNMGLFVLLGASVVVAGALLAAPWSRIRPLWLWASLFVGLSTMVPLAAAVILMANTWSAMHGAGGRVFALVAALMLVWAAQLPAVWFLRTRRAVTRLDIA